MILGIRGIEESSVYQDIFAKGEAAGEAKAEAKGRAEGRIEAVRSDVLKLGSKKFGHPDEGVRAILAAINDSTRLDAILVRILDVTSWDELLSAADRPA